MHVYILICFLKNMFLFTYCTKIYLKVKYYKRKRNKFVEFEYIKSKICSVFLNENGLNGSVRNSKINNQLFQTIF